MSNDEKLTEQERLARERVELMKLKQGLIDESDTFAERRRQYTKSRGMNRVKDFIYHNKPALILGTIGAFLMIFIAVDILGKENPDIRIMFVSDEYAWSDYIVAAREELQEHAQDFNEDGKVLVGALEIFMDEDGDTQLYMANSTKLVTEMQSGKCILIVAEEDVSDQIYADELFVDMTTLYPDNQRVDVKGYYIAGTAFAESIGWEDCPEDVYLGIRTPDNISGDAEEVQERYEQAKQTLDSIIEMG